MSWTSKGDRVAAAQAELAAEQGDVAILRAQTTHVLRRAEQRLTRMGNTAGVACIGSVLAERRTS